MDWDKFVYAESCFAKLEKTYAQAVIGDMERKLDAEIMADYERGKKMEQDKNEETLKTLKDFVQEPVDINWISVEDELPAEQEQVFVYSDGEIGAGKWTDSETWIVYPFGNDWYTTESLVTHWAPITMLLTPPTGQSARKTGLTPKEQIVMNALTAAWGGYVNLSEVHPSHLGDFMKAIHECQRLLTIRAVKRERRNLAQAAQAEIDTDA